MKTWNLFNFIFLSLLFLSTNSGFAQPNSNPSHHPQPTIYTDSTAAMVVTQGTNSTMGHGHDKWIIIQNVSSPIFKSTRELGLLLERGGSAMQRIPNGPIRIQLPRTEASKLRIEVLRGQIKIKELVIRVPGNGPRPYLIRMHDVLISSYQSSGSAGGDSIPQDSFSINFAKIEY